MQIWSADYPVAKVISGKWGDDYAALKIINPGIGASVEAYIEQITYGEIREEISKKNANRIVDCVNACEGIEDPAEFRKVFGEMREALSSLLWVCQSADIYPSVKTPFERARQVLVKADELFGNSELGKETPQ